MIKIRGGRFWYPEPTCHDCGKESDTFYIIFKGDGFFQVCEDCEKNYGVNLVKVI